MNYYLIHLGGNELIKTVLGKKETQNGPIMFS